MMTDEMLVMDKGDACALAVCAVRYALGRRTYIVSTVCDAVKRIIKDLDDKDLYVMIRDIRECDDYGDDIDKVCWFELLSKLMDEYDERKM